MPIAIKSERIIGMADEEITLSKLIPICRVHDQSCTCIAPAGYMLNRGYILTSGGMLYDLLKHAGEKFMRITEVQTPLRPEVQEAAGRLRKIFSTEGSTIATAYTPTMIADVGAVVPRWSADTRLNHMMVALSLIQFPFDNLSLLDLGSATGYMSLGFDSYGLNVTGVEADSNSVGLARGACEVVSGSANFHVSYVVPFLSKCPDSFDVILMLNVLHWIYSHNRWGLEADDGRSKVSEFMSDIADRTRLVLFIAFNNLTMKKAMGLEHKEGLSRVDMIDGIYRWTGGKFASIEFCVAGKAYSVYMCKK